MKSSNSKEPTILLGVCGGIACYKVADLASHLTRNGYAVHTVMTEAATKFVAPLTFQYITGNRVHQDLFAPTPVSSDHIALADRADLIVLAPATANTIGKLANGIVDNLLTAVITASTATVLVAPAMNHNMFHAEPVQTNLTHLAKRGWSQVGPDSGRLACGAEGQGRLAEPSTILDAVKGLLPAPSR